MPEPKDPVKRAQYREKMRAIALARGYGKWMLGRKLQPGALAKMSAFQRRHGRTKAERKRRSARAKRLGYGKWMLGRPSYPAAIAKLKARRGKTYLQIYGSKSRAEAEARKRRVGNRRRFIGVTRKPQRPKHNGDWRYANWRKKVFTRDDYTCQRCGKRGAELHAHHIKPWAKFPRQRFAVANGKTLHAKKCHAAEHREMKPT